MKQSNSDLKSPLSIVWLSIGLTSLTIILQFQAFQQQGTALGLLAVFAFPLYIISLSVGLVSFYVAKVRLAEGVHPKAAIFTLLSVEALLLIYSTTLMISIFARA